MSKFDFVWLGLILAGCGQYPNPNDLASLRPESRAEIANKRLDSAEETLKYKVEVSREITDEQRNDLIKELAKDMLTKIDPKAVSDRDQWMYAALLRVTDQWPEAEVALEKAVKAAPNVDRKVNDSLKLAQAQAKNNKIAEAIATANSVLTVGDADAAPILPAVLYEIVPAAQGKSHDKELADLLAKAIECHKRVKFSPNSESGRAFMVARSHHIGLAETKIGELSASKN